MGRYTVHQNDGNADEIVDVLHAYGWTVFTLGDRGLPDKLLVKAGKAFPAEIKTKYGTLTPLQQRVFKQFEAAGLPVTILRSVDDAIEFMRTR